MSARPAISVVLPCFNALQYTAFCVASIERHTPESHEIVLVDNGSTDGTADWFAERGEGCLVVNRDNLGFPIAANQGMAAAEGDVVIVLNNDTLATGGWSTALLDALAREPDVGIAAPRSNFVIDEQCIEDVPYTDAPSAELDRFGARLFADNRGRGRELPRLSGLCMAIARPVIERVGGFDPVFGMGNFEDDDYSLRVRAAGWRLWLAEDSFIHHFGHRAFDQLPDDYDRLLHVAAARFCRKWGLPTDRDPRGADPVRAFDPRRDHVPLLSPALR